MPYDFSVSNEVPNNSEQDRNIVPDCKTALDELGHILGGTPKQRVRGFERWLEDYRSMMSPTSEGLAKIALLTLKTMDQPGFDKSETMKRESAKDLHAFARDVATARPTAAHAEWRR